MNPADVFLAMLAQACALILLAVAAGGCSAPIATPEPIKPLQHSVAMLSRVQPETDVPFHLLKASESRGVPNDEQFGAPSSLAFDSQNRPYMFDTSQPKSFGYILTLRDGEWIALSYIDAVLTACSTTALPKQYFRHALGSITFDDANALYAIIPAQRTGKGCGDLLLFSQDLGKSFRAYQLPGQAFLEVRSGHNKLPFPPAIGVMTFRKEYPADWTAYHNFDVFLAEKTEDGLRLGDPLRVSRNAFGIANHSGGYSFAVTNGQKTHLVYAEIPDRSNGGNPTYVATIDRRQREVTARRLLANASPRRADVHSTPVITIDSGGFLHVLTGAHTQSFYYLKSTYPDDISSEWTDPTPMASGQTYATLVCDERDHLHSVFRVIPNLMYQRKAAGLDVWPSRVDTLVAAPDGHQGYAIFYHRLFIDRKGVLYLSFKFFSRDPEAKHFPRLLVLSSDGGDTWQAATTPGLVRLQDSG